MNLDMYNYLKILGKQFSETINGEYKLFVRASRHFGGSVLRGEIRSFRNERGSGGKTIIMFTKTREKGYLCVCRSTPGSNSLHEYTVIGIYLQLYSHTECFAWHSYIRFTK